uniref:Homeobox domain-containing protein n=1 Tax=Felis catus TaxID=9685 RepID=A0ABI7YRU8_FELCA
MTPPTSLRITSRPERMTNLAQITQRCSLVIQALLCHAASRPRGPSVFSGKTRTKDKYRVVYTDHQRLELEKEFHYSRYITIRRKSELAANLGLTERQVKIWFQNRRAKERKVNKKKQQQQQPPPPAHEVAPTAAGPSLGGLGPSSASLLGASSPMPVKEEYLP